MSLPRIQDDLYMAVNGTWQQNTVIPPDKSVVSADSDLTDSIRIKLVADLIRMLSVCLLYTSSPKHCDPLADPPAEAKSLASAGSIAKWSAVNQALARHAGSRKAGKVDLDNPF